MKYQQIVNENRGIGTPAAVPGISAVVFESDFPVAYPLSADWSPLIVMVPNACRSQAADRTWSVRIFGWRV